MKNRILIGLVFLALQLGSIVYSRFIPERFFCWRPYDSHTEYRIKVTIDGRVLSDEEVGDRYRYKSKAYEPRSIHNVFSIIRQYEETYGKDDEASVVVIYSTNGNTEQTWRL